MQRIGAWSTGTDFGSAEASSLTRAVIALRGLLALPQREARYYNAAVDDAGRPLNGHCQYRVTGGAIPARWWSITLYDQQGFLVRNAAGIYSVAGGAAPDPANWSITIGPGRQPGLWLPSGDIDRFELTLRTYLPEGEVLTAAQLPHIEQGVCG